MVVLLIAGIGFLLAGLLAVGLRDPDQGIQLRQYFDHCRCDRGLHRHDDARPLDVVVRELKDVARSSGPGAAMTPRVLSGDRLPPTRIAHASVCRKTTVSRSTTTSGAANPADAELAASTIRRRRPGRKRPRHAIARATRRRRGRAEARRCAKPRRNLLFSSTSRRNASALRRGAEPSAADVRPAPPRAGIRAEPQPATFEDAWPQVGTRQRDRDAPPQRRSGRAPSAFAELASRRRRIALCRSAAHEEDRPGVTVLKSGVVDGMAYSLYSDGSIEAQMPEGMMRFASIDELRAHLDQRP